MRRSNVTPFKMRLGAKTSFKELGSSPLPSWEGVSRAVNTAGNFAGIGTGGAYIKNDLSTRLKPVRRIVGIEEQLNKGDYKGIVGDVVERRALKDTLNAGSSALAKKAQQEAAKRRAIAEAAKTQAGRATTLHTAVGSTSTSAQRLAAKKALEAKAKKRALLIAGAKIAGKAAARFIPGVGWVLAAKDVYDVGKYAYENRDKIAKRAKETYTNVSKDVEAGINNAKANVRNLKNKWDSVDLNPFD
jgi:hypothetical protein